MADWFAKLMQRGGARDPRAVVRPHIAVGAGSVHSSGMRDDRYDAVVQRLRDRELDDRSARERRQRWYRQNIDNSSTTDNAEPSASSPVRLHKLRAKVPCRASREAEALLDQLRKRFAGHTIRFSQLANGKQALMLGTRAGTTQKQIGWIEQCVDDDPKRCNLRSQGLSVETDGGSMLVLRFRYPSTEVEVGSAEPNSIRSIDFAELRPALDLRPAAKDSSPRLVWVTRPEREMMSALQCRDYEAFYLRFKLEVQAGIWASLLGLLSSLPVSQWHHGSCYTIEHEPDAASRKVYQRSLDDGGRTTDIGQNRTYDAASATDILLLYLEGDILADLADIYFTLQSLSSADAYFVKEEFFTVVRRFWASAESLTSLYGGGVSALMRMCQRAVPMPAQAPMLKQDWTNLRQCLVDRYGKRGWKATDLGGSGVHRQRVGRGEWPFATFPAGEVNIGLRLIYRQEWRHVGAKRGEVVRTLPLGDAGAASDSANGIVAAPVHRDTENAPGVEQIVEKGESTRNLGDLVKEIMNGVVEAMKSPVDSDGSIQIGARALALTPELGLESESRESSRDTSVRLTDIASRSAADIPSPTLATERSGEEQNCDSLHSSGVTNNAASDSAICVHHRLYDVYEVLTRPAEIQNVVLIAERLPTPAEIDRSWVRRHDWILAKVLLDDSFREALETIGREAEEQPVCQERDVEMEATRQRLYEHIRANILHYQRAIWLREDPQQRSMRYRKSGKKVPLEWRFELESDPELTIDVLAERLAGTNVDGHFAAYSPGRESDLDQLIDPAGLIGYHGNYAVFRMRPEFGNSDLFSLLHFFKAPYLRPNPQTGAPEIDDPAQIRMCDEASPMASIDAECQFRRERGRRLSLGTNGVIIDIVRSPQEVEESAPSDCDIDSGGASPGLQLILDNAPEVELLASGYHHGADFESAMIERAEGKVLACGCEAARDMKVGDDSNVVCTFAERRPTLCVGQSSELERDQEILAADDVAAMASLVTGVGSLVGERVIHSRVDMERSTGRPHDPRADSGILTPDARHGTLTLRPRQESPKSEAAAVSLGLEERVDKLCVGRAQVDAEGVLEPASGGVQLSSGTGGGAARAHQWVILAADDAQSTANLVAGAGASNDYGHMVLAQDDEWLRPGLVVG